MQIQKYHWKNNKKSHILSYHYTEKQVIKKIKTEYLN